MEQIKDQVEHIVNTLENPELVCRECGIDVSESAERCPECDSSNLEPLTAFDYLTEALDIEYVIGSDRQFLGARVLVCFGGPNVWIDTRHNRVDGHWWQDSYNAAFNDNMGLNDAVQELWECQ